MSGGGGKGGTETTEIQLTPEMEAFSQDVMNSAATATRTPFQPNQGVEVAAMNPMQMAAIQGSSQAAEAFGLPFASNEAIQASMPGAPIMNAGGVQGYSSYGTYEANRNATYTPEYQEALALMYTDPLTGQARNPAESPMYHSSYGGSSGGFGNSGGGGGGGVNPDGPVQPVSDGQTAGGGGGGK